MASEEQLESTSEPVHKSSIRCPRCRSNEIFLSSRRGFFEFIILPLLLLRPFRCERCISRFYSFVRW